MNATELVSKAIEISTSATGFPSTLSEEERKGLLALSLEWGGKRILGAWKLYQDNPAKRGKPFRFFMDDYPQFLPRVTDATVLAEQPSILTDCSVCGSQYQKLRPGGCNYCEEHPDLVRLIYVEKRANYSVDRQEVEQRLPWQGNRSAG
jgi:hypothetical protein